VEPHDYLLNYFLTYLTATVFSCALSASYYDDLAPTEVFAMGLMWPLVLPLFAITGMKKLWMRKWWRHL
jgi:hypothetical protein